MERRRVDLRREKVEGELGDDGLEERWKNVGLFLAVALHWSLGVSGTDAAGTVAVAVVRHRRDGVDRDKRGVEGFEKNPANLVVIFGLGLVVLVCGCNLSCLSLITTAGS